MSVQQRRHRAGNEPALVSLIRHVEQAEGAASSVQRLDTLHVCVCASAPICVSACMCEPASAYDYLWVYMFEYKQT